MKKGRLIVICLVSFIASLAVSAQQTEPLPRDNFYDRISPTERELIPYDNIREADVMWQKRVWRVIDSQEKMNLLFRYEGIDWKDMSPLVTIMLNAVKNGEIHAYTEDNFKTQYTPAQVAQIGSSVDTLPLNDLDGNYIKDTVVVNEFDPSAVRKYRIKEDWFFDEETSTMQCRIMAVAPVYYDTQAQIELPMFWAYYPELRTILIKQDAFNWKNDAVRMSWDDVFEMRMFSSYIYKESNVFDRRISEYATGVDALRESDRIKTDIFNYEHDLWSF